MFLKRVMSTSKHLSVLSNGVMKTEPTIQPDYEACIEILNNLQSNAQYIKASSGSTTGSHNPSQLAQVEKYFARIGKSLSDLDKLSVIHVAGTKGKGTTCAFSESILRHHGYKTGFFSSPHLLEVRERIRIDGKPIARDEFAKHFWSIYKKLDQQKNDEYDMPLYFRFLTIMAFSMFLEKEVDVAIVEVGIGGEYDCTNILRKVPVVGITSLGIDHTALLGSTLESIAWNKAGIMKERCRAFTVPQPEDAMTVLKERSLEKKCHLTLVEPTKFNLPTNSSCPPHILNVNASLAINLCEAWLSIKQNNNKETRSFSEKITQTALANCVWPGRFQVKRDKNITYYLDGAHTIESIEICSSWFKDITTGSQSKRALMFNVTGGRDSENLLKLLRNCRFHRVIFVTNNATRSDKSDNINCALSADDQLGRCERHKELWLKMEQSDGKQAEVVGVFPTVFEALEFLNRESESDLLVTGSLHLIGAVLSIVEPKINEDFVV